MEDFQKLVEEQYRRFHSGEARAYGEIEINDINFYQSAFENAHHQVIDYGYQGKRFYNVLNPEYQELQAKRRIVRAAVAQTFKRRYEYFWKSTLDPLSLAKFGDSGQNYTLKHTEDGMTSVKPITHENQYPKWKTQRRRRGTGRGYRA